MPSRRRPAAFALTAALLSTVRPNGRDDVVHSFKGPTEALFRLLLKNCIATSTVDISAAKTSTGVSPPRCSIDQQERSQLRGATPLLQAIANQITSAAHMLLSAGADPDLAGDDGVTPLMHAVLLHQVEVAQWLLAAGANAIAVEPRLGKTALHFATASRSELLVTLLLSQATEGMCYAKDGSGKTARDIAKAQMPAAPPAIVAAFNRYCGASSSPDGDGDGDVDATGTPRYTGHCQIPHVDAASLSTSHFIHDFMAVGQPFVLVGRSKSIHWFSPGTCSRTLMCGVLSGRHPATF